jgi:GAF domain-containing protein
LSSSIFEPGAGADSAMGRLVKTACALFSAPIGLCSIFVDDRIAQRTLIGLSGFAPTTARPVQPDPAADRRGPGRPAADRGRPDRSAREGPRSGQGPDGLRFYAGATVADRSGKAVGSIGVMDTRPRPPLTADEIEHLRRFAVMAGDLFELERDERAASAKRETLELAESMAGVGHFSVDVATGQVTWSDEVFRIHGLEPGAVDPTLHSAIGAYHPDDAAVVRALVDRALQTGEGYDSTLRITRADGEERTTRSKARCELDADGRPCACSACFRTSPTRSAPRAP